MYGEQLSKLTRKHFQVHLPAYLTAIEAFYDTKVRLDLPKRFDISTVVGGTVGVSKTTLPAFAITDLERVLSNSDEDGWTYVYPGQLGAMVMAPNAELVETIARRYAGAFEMFLNDHRRAPVPADFVPSSFPFRLMGFGYTRTEYFGAATLDMVEEGVPEIWIDGFRIDFFWETMEAGPGQHG